MKKERGTLIHARIFVDTETADKLEALAQKDNRPMEDIMSMALIKYAKERKL